MPTEPVRVSFRRHVREQVLRVTRELTIEKGWDQVRMSDVAESVGVSRPTLYKEFGDKQGLGDALVVSEGQPGSRKSHVSRGQDQFEGVIWVSGVVA